MAHDLAHILIDAWNRVRPRLLADGDELARRLARRSSPQLTRPPRAFCIAVRASDRRINAASAILTPGDAADVAAAGRYVDPQPHEVILDSALLRRLGGAVDLTAWRGHRQSHAAALLGVSDSAIAARRQTNSVKSDRIAGLGGARVAVPLVWRDRVSDPNAANAQEPPHPIWGNAWRRLADALPDDFAQSARREPDFRTGRMIGWRWICPPCQRRVRSLLMPTPVMNFIEWLGDREILDRVSGTDAVRPAAMHFACTRCHRVRHFTALTDGSWNQLIAVMTGGLLYGSEVRRPEGFERVRKRRQVAHRVAHARGDELERLLLEGRSYNEAAEAMGVTLSTVQGHVRRLYARRGVHSRRELAATAR